MYSISYLEPVKDQKDNPSKGMKFMKTENLNIMALQRNMFSSYDWAKQHLGENY